MKFDVSIKYRSEMMNMKEWDMAGCTKFYSVEAPHILDAMWRLAQGFPIKYAGDIESIHVFGANRQEIIDQPDPIREGDGWKAREGRG